MNISTYQRTGTYTLKDGTVKPTSYVIKYTRKLPKYTTNKKLKLRQNMRRIILNLDNGGMLDKLNYLLRQLLELKTVDATEILSMTEDLLKTNTGISN